MWAKLKLTVIDSKWAKKLFFAVLCMGDFYAAHPCVLIINVLASFRHYDNCRNWQEMRLHVVIPLYLLINGRHLSNPAPQIVFE